METKTVGRVNGKVAIVTGAGQGLGRGCAIMLSKQGAQLVIADIKAEEDTDVATTIRNSGGEALYVPTDVTDESQCQALIQNAICTFGKLDVLINNAGWFPRATLEETTSDLWDKVLNVNLRGAFYCCKYAIPQMVAQGGGSIINIGSINGIQGLPNLVAYSAAKGGLFALTRTLAGAYASQGIRVNCVVPGWVLTEGEIAVHKSQGLTEEQMIRSGGTLPLGRHQTADDISYAVVYLASDESEQVTGTVLNVDAGLSTLPLQPRPAYAD